MKETVSEEELSKKGLTPDKQEILYRNLLENSIDAVYLTNEHGKILDANNLASKHLKRTRKEILQLSIEDIDRNFDPESFKSFWEPRPEEEPLLFESMHRRKDGTVFPVEINGIAFKLGNKKLMYGVVRDITARKKNEETLRKREEQFRFLAENTSDLVILHEPNGSFKYISPALERILGYTPEEYRSFDPYEKLFPEDRKKVRAVMRDIARGADLTRVEARVYKKDGSLIWFETRTRVIRNKEGEVHALVSSSNEITRRKETELALMKSEERFRQMFENTSLPIARVNLDYVIEDTNKAYCNMLGYTRKELSGKRLHDITHPETLAENLEMQEKLRKGEIESFTLEKKFMHKKGHTLVGLLTASLFRDTHGNPDFFLGNILDITKRKEWEEKLKKSEEQLRNIIEQAADAIYITDLSGKIIEVNDKFIQELGYTAEELREMTIYDISRVEAPEAHQEEIRSMVKQGKPVHIETSHYRKDGSKYQVELSIGLNNYMGKPVIIGISRDISEHKAFEEKLRVAKQKAEESDRLKSAFMANMSHEIRTPLNGILGFSKLICEPDLARDDQEHYSSIIQNSGHRLLSVVNDILDISLIQANQLKLNREEVNLKEFFTELFTFYQTMQHDSLKNIDLSVHPPGLEQDLLMVCDKNRLYQIFKNLLDNAFKFTRKGCITFGYRKNPGKTITFFVEDSGMGISKEKQKRIFRSFEKGEDNLQQKYEGTGLGLSIADGLVSRMKGKIGVKSSPGKGSLFHFELPLTVVEKSASQKKPAPGNSSDFSGKKLLVVEDDKVSYELLVLYLEQSNITITHATTSEEALRILKDITFDLILMDIRLPGMDGHTATRKIRSMKIETPVIAQTAYAMQGDSRKTLEAGCNDYISKPIDRNILHRKLRQFLK